MARKLMSGAACALSTGMALVTGTSLITACLGDDGVETVEPQVVAPTRSAVGAVVVLEDGKEGCTAVKVGPKHLLLAARCVTNRPAYAIGKRLRFHKGNVAVQRPEGAEGDAASDARREPPTFDAGNGLDGDAGSFAPEQVGDAGADLDGDAGSFVPERAEGGGDAGQDVTGDAYESTIAKIEIHPSFLSKCGLSRCAFGDPDTADVADVAVIFLADDNDLPIAPVDLDPVSKGDRVLVLSNGCGEAAFDPAPQLRAAETTAVAADAALHEKSPYSSKPELGRSLSKSYVVTLGPGNSQARQGLGVCGARDLGAPVFRSDGSSVVGVNSNATGTAGAPMTNEHARVDGHARYEVGGWLAKMGVMTTKSCSTTATGCPPIDPEETGPIEAGTDAPGTGTGGQETDDPAPVGDGTKNPAGRSSPGRAPKRTSKKPSAASGCSTAFGSPSNPGAFGLVALAALVARLRRRGRG